MNRQNDIFNNPVPVNPNGAGQMHAPVPWQNGPANWNSQDYIDPRMVLEDDTSFSPQQIFLYLIRYRWVISVVLATGLILGILASALMVPKYRADAMIEVQAPSARVIEDLEVLNRSDGKIAFRTALEKLKSREMARRVIAELRLADNQSFLFPNKGFSLSNLVARVIGQNGKTLSDLGEPERERLAITRLSKNMKASLLRGTSIISITYSSESKELARKITNQFANSYIASKLDQSSETSRLARRFIGEQVSEVKKRLEKAEQELVVYAKANGITFDDKNGSLTAASIKALNEGLSKAIEDRLKFQRLVAQVNAGKASGLEDVIRNEAIQKTRLKLSGLQAEYSQKLSTFKPSYPEMRALAAQIKQLKFLLSSDIKLIADSVKQKYKVASQRETDLRNKMRELEVTQANYQEKNIKYTILKREVDSFRSQYKSLIDKLNQLGVAAEVKNKAATIIQYAVTPNKPYSPRILFNLAVALAASIVFAAALIYLLELLNNTFSNPDQLEAELKLPVLGIIPKFSDEEFRVQISDPRSNLSEAFRTLRTALQFTGISGAPKSLMVTSTEPAEGKSTITQKLAENFGQLGLKVLIVDADMRRPTQHRIAGIPNSLGLSNLLTNTVHVSQVSSEVEVMRNTPWENVWLVTAGTPPPNPADLLSSEKMGLFVEACTSRFDIVLIDSPPVIGLADALLLSRLAEASMMVVSARKATRKAVQGALKRLKSAAGHIVGTTLNRFEMDNIEYKYSYNYMNTNYLNYGAENVDSAPETAPAQKIGNDADRKEGALGS